MSRSAVLLAAMVIVSSGSNCDDSQVSLYPYELWAKARTGQTCIGGPNRPNWFELHQEGRAVQTLTVWWNGVGLKAIAVQFFGSSEVLIRGNAAFTESRSITFKAGETIVGDITLTNSNSGQRTGYIQFKTSEQQTLEAGNPNGDRYAFPSGNSFLSGFIGWCGEDIDTLGILLWKPIASAQLLGMSYPMLDTQTLPTRPNVIYSNQYCNPSDQALTVATITYQATVTREKQSCWSLSASFEVSESVSVKGTVPDIAEVSASTEWKLTVSGGTNQCKTDTVSSTETIQLPALTLPPHSATAFSVTQWKGVISSLPFTATLQYTFTDGSAYSTSTSGLYSGVSYSKVSQSFAPFASNISSCSLV